MPQSNPTHQYALRWYKSSRNMLRFGASDESTQAPFGSNPTVVWYWDVACAIPDPTAGVSIDVVVKITYYVRVYGSRIENYDV